MKASHKAHVAKAAKLRTELAEKVVEASKASMAVGLLNEEIVDLHSKISEVESAAADDGLSVSDLHDAVNDLKAPKKKS